MGFSQNSLVSCIYEMALGRSTWDNILDILAATFPGCLVLVSGDNLVTGDNIAFAQRGLTAEAAASYVASYAARNPLRAGQTGLAPHQVYHDEQLVDRRAFVASRFHEEWLSRQGDFVAATGVVVLREGPRQLSIEVRYPIPRQGELRDRIAAILGEAAHHFGRAFEISSRSRFADGRGYLEGIVADLPFSVFFVDAQLRIHYANGEAEALRRRPDGPFASGEGTLRAADVASDAQLRHLVGKVLSTRRAPPTALPLSHGEIDERYFAIARPALRSPLPHQLHDLVLDPGPLVILVIHGSLEMSSLPTDLIWRAFSFTESEALLAEALLNGGTLSDFAKEREVSKQTLRNQLMGVMRKTGTRRQSELVSLLTRFALTCV